MGGVMTEQRPVATAAKSESKCPIHVLHDVVAIVIERGKSSAGGIILPDNMKDKTLTGKIVAVGPGRYPDDYVPDYEGNKHGAARFPMSVEIGQIAVFPTLVGLEIEVEGVKYCLVHEGDILAIIDK